MLEYQDRAGGRNYSVRGGDRIVEVGGAIKAGETVRIEETKPISKLKTWKVLDKVDTHSKPKTAADA